MGIRIIIKHLREKQNNREKSELCVVSRTAKWGYSLFAICTETKPLFVLFKCRLKIQAKNRPCQQFHGKMTQ
jgi:hypothetical protein